MDSPAATYKPFVSLLRRLQLTSGNLRSEISKELGISMSELNALSHVTDNENLTPKKLSELMDLTTGSTTTMIDRLARAGFLARQPHPTDRRSVLLTLTPNGKQSMKWINEHYLDAVAAAFDSSPGSRLDAQTEFLEALVKSMEDSMPGQKLPPAT